MYCWCLQYIYVGKHVYNEYPTVNKCHDSLLLTTRSIVRGQHDSGYQALMGAPENITIIVTTARHYHELFSASCGIACSTMFIALIPMG